MSAVFDDEAVALRWCIDMAFGVAKKQQVENDAAGGEEMTGLLQAPEHSGCRATGTQPVSENAG